MAFHTGGKLPFGAASFDSVLAVLRRPESGELLLGEIGRVLKSEGQIIIQTYLPSTLLDKVDYMLICISYFF